MNFVEYKSKIMNEDLSRSLQLVHFRSLAGTTVKVTNDISIDDLLGDVNRHEYYRYSGSLTTPLCSETVVWTIFKESINVDLNLVSYT